MLKKLISLLLALLLTAVCVSFYVSASEVTPTDTPTVSESDPVTPPEPEPEIAFSDLAPVLTAKTGGYNSIFLSWEEVEGAVKYEIWTSGSANGTYSKITTVSNVTSYTRTGRAFNKTFYYKVRAINGEGEYSKYSNPSGATTLPSKVKGIKAAAASYRSIKVSWSKVSGASGYTIYRSASENGTYTAVKRITSGSTLSWTNSSLTTGKTYYYKVRAYRNSGGKRIYGEYSDIVSAVPRLTAPSTLTLTKSSYAVNVKWSAVSGATGYKLYRSTDPEGEFTLLGTTSSSKRTFANTSVVPGVTYYYKVTAIRNSAESGFSAVKSIVPSMAAPTSVNALSCGYDSVKVTWKAVSGASGYHVFRSDCENGEYVKIGETTDKSYTESGLETGRTYYYKVCAYRTSGGMTGFGSMSKCDPAKPMVPTPVLSSASKYNSSSIKVSWKQSAGADGYYLYRSGSKNGTYSQTAKIEGGSVLSHIDTGRSKNTSYYYKVSAYRIIDGVEKESYLSSPLSGKITSKVAYLTFDDGPSCNTMKILDILDRYGVKATFFVVGKSGRDKEYKAIVDRGHTIALHTYTHNYAKIYASEKAFFSELDKLSDKIYGLTGVRTKIIRFPGGSSNTVYRKYCSGLMAKLKKSVPAKGYYYHDWNVSSGDANGNNVAKSKLISNVKGGCKGKNTVNILMHDTGSAKNTTVSALPSIIEYLLSQGYDIQPITEGSVLIQH